MNEKYKQIVNLYIRAKDRHLPHLMRLAFANDAILEMQVNTNVVSFPSKTVGLENITDSLVNDFHLRFNNVYTFCIKNSELEFENELRCTWLVGMTDIETGSLIIGYGEYHWRYNEQVMNDELRAQRLVIVINNMIVLPPESVLSALPWFDTLPHPWVALSDVSLSPPEIPIIHEFFKTDWRVRK